jgi:predicted GIY-YIG superfamily endonuclease
MTGEPGVIYMLHFSAPFGHARHYVGWAKDLEARLAVHGSNGGAKLMWYVHQAGLTWIVARTRAGTRDDERRIKRAGGSVRYCPVCSPTPWNGSWGPLEES